MTKTIKEMSAEYCKVKYIVIHTADGGREIDKETGAEFFEDGARAVLEEIEKLMPDGWLSVGDGEKIKEKIKQLKGE